MAKRRGSSRRSVNRCSKPTHCASFSGRKGQLHDGKFCKKVGVNRCK